MLQRILEAKLDRGSESSDEVDFHLDFEDAPLTAVASPRLKDDVRAQVAILGTEGPPLVQIRAKTIISVVYGFGDASGSGLGSTFTCGNGFTFRIGVWGSSDKEESSNWKEFTNVVEEALEEEARTENLDQSEIFMFTDNNSTVESCSYKGTSSSPKLLSLVIRLKAMASWHGLRLNIFHVAGTRMIAQGTDGVSRGFLAQGIMAGETMESFIPIHLTAVQRSPTLEGWIHSWTGHSAIMLNEEGWFEAGHDIAGLGKSQAGDDFERRILKEGRTYVWCPQPFAADVAIAELRKARIKRQSSAHVFVCPRLCCGLWLKNCIARQILCSNFCRTRRRGRHQCMNPC